MSEIILDSVTDSIKLIPFLFLTYLFMEWLEHKTGSAARKRIRTAGKFGPVWGGLLGVIPQCGFSAAASSLFSGRVITVGTLIAVYLSTSDEMFPIMISNAVPAITIVKILACKAAIGMFSGLVLEYVYTHMLKKQEPDMDIHDICEEERCHCEHGIISSAASHTLKVFVYNMNLLTVSQPFRHMSAECRQSKNRGKPVFFRDFCHLIDLFQRMKGLHTADVDLSCQFYSFHFIRHLLRPFPEISISYFLPMIRTWSMLTGLS